MALPNNPRDQYLRTQVETASKEQLVVMLFDGIIRFTEVARKAIEEKKIEDSHHALMRAQAIVMELICTVDKERGGAIAKNLMGLHAYAFNCLIACNMKKDVSKIDEVQKIYRKLREGWVGAMESLGIAPTKAAGSAAPAGAPVPPKPLGIASAPKAPVAAPAQPANQYPGKGPGGVLAQGRALPGLKPAVLGAPKAAVPGAPAAPKSAFGLPSMPKPAVPGIAPKAAASQIIPQPVASAQPAASIPAQPEAAPAPAAHAAPAISYGMGRTAAMMGAYGKPAAPAPAQPAVPSIPAVPATAAPAAAPAPAIKPVLNAKQAAMLNAYQANSRTSA